MGVPTKEAQAIYNANYDKAMQKWNTRRSFVKPIDPNSLTEAGRAYREHQAALNRQPTQYEAIISRLNDSVRLYTRPQVIDFDTAKRVVMHIYAQDLARKNKGVLFTDEQEVILDGMIRYFIADPESPYSLVKGLFVYGAYGVGKGWLFRVLQTLCKLVPIPEMQFEEVATKDFVEAYIDYKESKDKNKKVNPLLKYSNGNLLLNDLGEEPRVVISYKNEETPMDSLLSRRNICWDHYGHRTHVTSNLGQGDADDMLVKQLEAMYGTRILDRFYDLFEFILFPGESKRG